MTQKFIIHRRYVPALYKIFDEILVGSRGYGHVLGKMA